MRSRTTPHDTRRRAGFTLVELLAVMTIIILMVGLGMTAFKGGNGTDGTKGASAVASGVFSQARNEAIMRQTPCRVIIDTGWSASRPDLADHYLRRLAIAYLNPQGVDVNGQPTATSGLPPDPGNANNWLQANSWAVLPGNVFIDTNYSAVHGVNMTIAFNAPNTPSTGYCYYQFSPNGQAQYSSLARFVPGGSTTVSSTLPQLLVSPGRVDSSGNFQETTLNTPTNNCYGFVLFKMGNLTFFQNVSDIQKPS